MNIQLREVSVAGSTLLRGIGQIMLQDNTWTGVFLLAGIFCSSWMAGVAAVVAVFAGTATAKLLNYADTEIRMGWYGFNAALTGVAFVFFYQPSLLLCIMIIVGSAVSSVIHHLLIKRKFPSYTFPFIIVTWLFMAVTSAIPGLVEQQTVFNATPFNDYMRLFSYSFGQVIFQESRCAGLLFVLGVFIGRPVAALYAIAGIAVSAAIAYGFHQQEQDIFSGIWSYNAVLCAIVFTGKKAAHILKTLVAVVLSVAVLMLMKFMKLPALTFPFVVAVWVTLLIPSRKETASGKKTG